MHLWYHIYTGYAADTGPFPYRATATTSGEGMDGYLSQETTELHVPLV